MILEEKLSLVRTLLPPAFGVNSETLLALKVGSGIRIKDALYVVKRALTYQEVSKKGNLKYFKWREYELVNLRTFETQYLEVEKDDRLCFYMTDKKVPCGMLSDLPDGKPRKLYVEGMDDALYLDEVCHARFSDNAKPEEHEQVTMLDYESKSGEKLLGVEVWGEGNCEAYFYSELDLQDMEIFAHEND
jgi:hypothetical protein